MDWKAKLSRAKAASDKARTLVEAEAREAREVAGKAKQASRTRALTIIEEHWPKVQRLFRATLETTTVAALHDDKRMRRILLLVYGELPVLVRVAVEEDEFIEFCLRNRNRLLLPEDAAAPEAPKEVEPAVGEAAQADAADEAQGGTRTAS